MNGGDTVNTQANDNSNEDDGPIFNDDDVDERRDQIAQAMWSDYQKVCEERRNMMGTTTDGSTESDSDDDDELDAVL